MRRRLTIGAIGVVAAALVLGTLPASADVVEPEPDPYQGTGLPEYAEVYSEPDVLFEDLVPEIPESDFVVGDDGQSFAIDEELAKDASQEPRRVLQAYGATLGLSSDEIAVLNEAGVSPTAPEDEILDAGECLIEDGADYMAGLRACQAAATTSRSIGAPGAPVIAAPLNSGIDATASSIVIGGGGLPMEAGPATTCQSAKQVRFISRFLACKYREDWKYIVEKRTGRTLGRFRVDTVTDLQGQKLGGTATMRTYIRATGRTGLATNATIKAKATFNCSGTCGYVQANAWAPTLKSSWQSNSAKVYADVAVGKAANVTATLNFQITASVTRDVSKSSSPSVVIRCDNNLIKSSGFGCVYPSVTPLYVVTPAAPDVATHIRKAIASGLPSTLSRGWPSQSDRNRAIACGAGVSRPQTGYSCDEYPFASTQQGAASTGRARVLPGSIYAQIPGTGPKGFSRCQVSATQNSKQGSDLGAFYKQNRVLPNDKFRVF